MEDHHATHEAVTEAAPLEDARAAAGAGAGGSATGGPGDPIIRELRRAGLLPFLVLELLAAGPSYGNQLMERVAGLTGGLLTVNPNTMYPLLRDLEQRGMIVGRWEHPERRSRRFYERTDDGAVERDRLAGQLGPHLAAIAKAITALRKLLA